MKKLALFLTAGAAIAAALAAAPAHAFAPARVWVSGTGTDSIGCGSVASPCATFSQALSLVAVGGESRGDGGTGRQKECELFHGFSPVGGR